jgi:hypothetical protein
MSLQSEQIPNRSLTGEELRQIAVKQFDEMLQKDCYFLKTVAYKRVAMKIEATFHFNHAAQTDKEPHKVRVKVQSDDPAIEGGETLKDPGEHNEFVALERDVAFDNPNLARVHNDLPIKVQARKDPRVLKVDNALPGEPPEALIDPFPEVETREIRYDKRQYPAPEPAVDKDRSEEMAARLGVRGRKGKQVI